MKIGIIIALTALAACALLMLAALPAFAFSALPVDATVMQHEIDYLPERNATSCNSGRYCDHRAIGPMFEKTTIPCLSRI